MSTARATWRPRPEPETPPRHPRRSASCSPATAPTESGCTPENGRRRRGGPRRLRLPSPSSCCAAASGRPSSYANSICRSPPTSTAWARTDRPPLVSVDLPATPSPGGPTFQVLLTLRSPLATATDPPTYTCSWPDLFNDPSIPSGAVFGIVTGLLPPAPADPCDCARPPHRAAPASTPPTRVTPAHLAGNGLAATQEARRISLNTALADLIPGPELSTPATPSTTATTSVARAIRTSVSPYRHPVGPARMGTRARHRRLVPARGAVHGSTSRVADASSPRSLPPTPPAHDRPRRTHRQLARPGSRRLRESTPRLTQRLTRWCSGLSIRSPHSTRRHRVARVGRCGRRCRRRPPPSHDGRGDRRARDLVQLLYRSHILTSRALLYRRAAAASREALAASAHTGSIYDDDQRSISMTTKRARRVITRDGSTLTRCGLPDGLRRCSPLQQRATSTETGYLGAGACSPRWPIRSWRAVRPAAGRPRGRRYFLCRLWR